MDIRYFDNAATTKIKPEVLNEMMPYLENEYGNAFQRYYDQNNSNRQAMGATRGLIEEYLCEDGRPIYIGGTEGNYEVNPLFKGYGMWKELDNRDPRLTQTVCRPGEYVTIWGNGEVNPEALSIRA